MTLTKINILAERHYAWVEEMGWHNKTVLESLALISSEFFELIAECGHDGAITENFGEELADIFLRMADMAVVHGIDIASTVGTFRATSFVCTPINAISNTLIDLGFLINSARKDVPNPDFTRLTGKIIRKLFDIADRQDIDLISRIEMKMEKNASNGTRGRRV